MKRFCVGMLMLGMLVSAAQANWTYVECVDHLMHPLAATNANLYFNPDGNEPVNAVDSWTTPDVRFRSGRVNGYYEGTIYEVHASYGDPPVYVRIDTGAPGTYEIKLYGGFKAQDNRNNVQTSLTGGMTWSKNINGSVINSVHGIDGQGWVTTDTDLGTLVDDPGTSDARGNVIIGQVTTDDGIIVIGIRNVNADRGLFDGLAYKSVSPAAKIVWVTGPKDVDADGIQDDMGWVYWMTDMGYNVDIRPGYWTGTLDPNKIAELEAADLVMISRAIGSGDPKAATFNPLTTPIINLNAWTMRSSRLKWLNSGTATKYNGAPLLIPAEGSENHPIFEGIDLSEGAVAVLDPNVGAGELVEGNTSFVDINDAGNGIVLAIADGATLLKSEVFIAEWAAGVEYYEGAGQFAGGPRMVFMAGTQDLNASDAPDLTIPATSGVFNLTEVGAQIMANAIKYLLPKEVGLGAAATYSLDTSVVIAGADGSGFTSLDGTWSHDHGNDSWDGSAIGEGSPGGISAIDGYLRFQDTGNPTKHGMPDPSNRKVQMVKDIGPDGASATVLDEGATLFFRKRLATDGLLDLIHPDNGGDLVNVPATGDGYKLHNGSVGTIGIKQSSGGMICFTLVTAEENENGGVAGLMMNSLNGNAVIRNEGDGQVLPLDPTVWHDFWVTIQADASGVGTHQVDVSVDGDPAQTFIVTATNPESFSGISTLRLGCGATDQSGAFDVAVFQFAPGVIPAPM